MKEKIIIGLSGGVDSTVSMKLLKDEGYDIEALFMKNWSDDLKKFELEKSIGWELAIVNKIDKFL